MEKRPNIIIFNPDEMRADSLGHLGNPAAHTPFLDQFAKTEAVSFRNAFCQNPVCVPSRCSFLTGLYPHVHGHRTMEYLMHENEPSIFSELKDAGYYVWMNSRNDFLAGQVPGLMKKHASEVFYGLPNSRNRAVPEGRPREADRRAFFNGRLTDDRNGDDDALEAAIRFLKSKPDQPICLFLGMIYPHPPYQVGDPYYSCIERNRIPPRIHPGECRGKSPIEEKIRLGQGIDASVNDSGTGYSESDWTELRAVYLGMCAKIDDQFRRLCEALKEVGEYDNSAIFFFSDHGDYTGDYGLAEKNQNTFEDCLVRVPLLIKPPSGWKLDPGVTDNMAELVDFYKTAMDMAGVKPSHTQFGRDLSPVLEDRSASVRDFVTCEGGRAPEERHCDEFHAKGPKGTNPMSPYYARQAAQTDPKLHTKGYMFRTKDFKLITRGDDTAELYDLRSDPKELKNTADEPAYAEVRRELEHRQLLWLMRTADVVPFSYDSRFTPEMGWAMISPMVPAEYEEEYREKLKNGASPISLILECSRRFHNHP